MAILGNAPTFVVLYILMMLPTYFLPFLGSNSAALAAMGQAAGTGINPMFWLHLGSLAILIALAWCRGTYVGKQWLVIFPILATVFDLVPGLSMIYMIPTFMHLLVIILGVIASTAVQPVAQSTVIASKTPTDSDSEKL